ncbi:hypothetical protein MBLNU459_g0693t1 [Dothideomycetes sp. NU459]
MNVLTPPTTPSRSKDNDQDRRISIDSAIGASRPLETPLVQPFDSEIDVSGGQLLGTGVWSKVYKIAAATPEQSQPTSSLLTPPSTPQRTVTQYFPRALAVKTAARPDAVNVFEYEAQVLTHLQQHPSSSRFIVPFLGFSAQNSALVFECALRGSLDQLVQAPFSSSADLLDTFLAVAPQLVAGLAFQHSAGVVHADIKPDNILLDTADAGSDDESPANLLARFADFGASFLKSAPNSSQGGGTWAYMAPEQMNRDPAISAPTFASDVYSLGITLLSLMIGDTPFAGMSNNLFMLREAVKCGTPINFAKREFSAEKRIDNLDAEWRRRGGAGSVLDFLRPALKKDTAQRCSAAEWVAVLEKMAL